MTQENHDHLIESLLIKLFEVDELRRFLDKIDGESGIIAELPGPLTSRVGLAHDAVRLLRRRGAIGFEFFASLERERPGQRSLILATAEQFIRRQAPKMREHRDSCVRQLRSSRAVSAVIASLVACIAIVLVGWRTIFNIPCIDVNACAIRCEGCENLTASWIVLEDGGTFTAEVRDNTIRFRCMREGTKFAVVLAIQNGQASIDYLSVDVVAEVNPEIVTIPFAEFTPSIPRGFSPPPFVMKVKTLSSHSAAKPSAVGQATVLSPMTSQISGGPPDSQEVPTLDDEQLSPGLAEETPADSPQVQSKAVPPPDPDTPISTPDRSPKRKQDIPCDAIRQITLTAHERRIWKRVISYTDSQCWSNDPQGLYLKVHALKEHGDFQGCIDHGTSSRYEAVLDMVRFCQKRLAKIREEKLGATHDLPCEVIRRNTIAAHERRIWKKVISYTDSQCWSDNPRGLYLKVHALKEHGVFQSCIDHGKGSRYEKVLEIVRFCEKRLARRGEEEISPSP